MLLKVIRHPQVLEPLHAPEFISGFNDFIEQPTLPAIREEHYYVLGVQHSVYHIDMKTGRTDKFGKDSKCPSNAVAVVEHGARDSRETIFITDDEEAYIISAMGNTVSVVVPPKQKGEQGSYNHKVIHPSAQNPTPPSKTISGQ